MNIIRKLFRLNTKATVNLEVVEINVTEDLLKLEENIPDFDVSAQYQIINNGYDFLKVYFGTTKYMNFQVRPHDYFYFNKSVNGTVYVSSQLTCNISAIKVEN